MTQPTHDDKLKNQLDNWQQRSSSSQTERDKRSLHGDKFANRKKPWQAHDNKPCPTCGKVNIVNTEDECATCNNKRLSGRVMKPLNPHDDTTEPMTVEQIRARALDKFHQHHEDGDIAIYELVSALGRHYNALIEQRERAARADELDKVVDFMDSRDAEDPNWHVGMVYGYIEEREDQIAEGKT